MDVFYYNKDNIVMNEKTENALDEFILYVNNKNISNNVYNKHLCNKTLRINNNDGKKSFNFYDLCLLYSNNNQNELCSAIITILSNLYIYNFTYANSMEIMVKHTKEFLMKYDDNKIKDNVRYLLVMQLHLLFLKELFISEKDIIFNNQRFPIKYSFLIDKNASPLSLNNISADKDIFIVCSFVICSKIKKTITLLAIKKDDQSVELLLSNINNKTYFQIKLPKIDNKIYTIYDIEISPNITYVFIFGLFDRKRVYFSYNHKTNEYIYDINIKSDFKINQILYGTSNDDCNFNGYLGPLIAFDINPKDYIYEFQGEYNLMFIQHCLPKINTEAYEKYTSINSNSLILLLNQQSTNKILFGIDPLKYRNNNYKENEYLYNIIENDYTIFQFLKSEGINYSLPQSEIYYQLIFKYSSTPNNNFILNHM